MVFIFTVNLQIQLPSLPSISRSTLHVDERPRACEGPPRGSPIDFNRFLHETIEFNTGIAAANALAFWYQFRRYTPVLKDYQLLISLKK